jgi:hypothetical protein
LLFYLPPQQKLRCTIHMRFPSRPRCGILYEPFRCSIITLCMNVISSENLRYTCFILLSCSLMLPVTFLLCSLHDLSLQSDLANDQEPGFHTLT